MHAPAPCPVATIFARRIRPGAEARYEEWLSEVSRVSATFAGSHGTTILKPADGREDYIAITHFDSPENMQAWLDSPERRRCLEQLASIAVVREEVRSLAGLERWFTLPGSGADSQPPRYKTAVLVLLGLYPVVMLLSLVLDPLLAGVPWVLRVLASLAVSVALMVWVVLPVLTRWFSWWLHPDAEEER